MGHGTEAMKHITSKQHDGRIRHEVQLSADDCREIVRQQADLDVPDDADVRASDPYVGPPSVIWYEEESWTT